MAKDKTEQSTLTPEEQTKLDNELIRVISYGKVETVKLLLEHPDIDVNAIDKDGKTALAIAQVRNCYSNPILRAEIVKVINSVILANDLVEEKNNYNPKSNDEVDFKVFMSRLENKLGQDFKDHINIICSDLLNGLGAESNSLPPLDLLINQKELQNFRSETSDNVIGLIEYYIDSIEKHFSQEGSSKFSDDIKYLFKISAAAEEREDDLASERIQELKEIVYQTNLKILESQIGSADIDVVGMIIQQLFPQEFAQAEERDMMGLEDHNVITAAAEEEAQLDVAGQASEEEY